jgi:hypothetical protein
MLRETSSCLHAEETLKFQNCFPPPQSTMPTVRIFSSLGISLLVLLWGQASALAQNEGSDSPSGSDTSEPPPSPNDNPAPQNPNTAGASGKTETAISLSTGDQIAIAVVVGVVVILALTSAVLFYLAKKRQWEVRASIRRSARRVTTAFKAKTPVKPNFSRRDRAMVRIEPPQSQGGKSDRKSKRSGGILKEGRSRPERSETEMRMDRDVEKGLNSSLGTRTKIEAIPPPAQPTPAQSGSQQLKSSFEMDSPDLGNRGNGAGNARMNASRWAKKWGMK